MPPATPPMPHAVRRPRRAALLAALAAAAALAGGAGACSSVLEVNNPNNVIEDSLSSVAAAPSLANGAAAITVRALNTVLDPYSTATDEMDFVGSQDGFFQLDVGNLASPGIQFSDNAFQRVAEARWLGDQALARFAAWDSAGVLPPGNRADRATAYLYAATTYAIIGDMFDDFALSDRAQSGPPVGEANMRQMYDTAVAYLDRGLELATVTNSATLRQQILATRARVKHARALWPKLNPPARYAGAPAPVASPLVNDAGATADALAALALVGAGDWTFTVTPSAPSANTPGTNNLGNDLNVRREMRIGQAYAQPDPLAVGQNRTRVAAGEPVIVLADPVTGQPDAALRSRVRDLINGGQFLPMTLVSARELHLILAEAAVAAGDAAEARARINRVRELAGGAPAWDGAAPDAVTMLRHMRRVHLFLMGRRLADMYRFGERDARWQTGSAAYTTRGCFLPITFTERQSNANKIPDPACAAP